LSFKSCFPNLQKKSVTQNSKISEINVGVVFRGNISTENILAAKFESPPFRFLDLRDDRAAFRAFKQVNPDLVSSFKNSLFSMTMQLGPERACKVLAWVGLRLSTAGSGFCGPGLAWWAGSGSGLQA
jgi:hypothetical protein